ncbi:TonB-dependent receptor, partial [bacterium]|nr:TonB-dependent receptor [bacterium]
FQVITNRFSAEYGRSLSGVVNVITKSGTNEWHGDVYSYFRDEKLDNPRWLFDYADMDFKEEEEKAKYNQQQYGFSLGGPIVKDKTHIFLNYEGWNNNATAYVTADPAWSYPGIDISGEVGQFPSTYKANQVFIKLDHQISPKHYLQVSYSLLTGRTRNIYVGGFSTQKFGASVEFDEHLFFISETFSISDRAVNEFRFQYGQRRNDWIPNDRHPSIYQYTAYGVITTSGSHPSVDQTNLTKRIQLKNDFYLTLPGTKTGEHNLKFGFDLQFLQGDHDTAYSKNGYYVIWYGTPYYYRQAFGQSQYKFNENVYGVYLQDDWKINRHLTLNLGVRWDYNSFAPDDTTNISPRLGFAIDPGGDGRAVIRGGFGIYHDMAFTQLLQTASALGEDGMATITFYPGASGYPSDWDKIDQLPAGIPTPARDIYTIDPAFNNAYSLQTSLGFSKQIGNDFSFSVDGV